MVTPSLSSDWSIQCPRVGLRIVQSRYNAGLKQSKLPQFVPAGVAKFAQRVNRVAVHHLLQFF